MLKKKMTSPNKPLNTSSKESYLDPKPSPNVDSPSGTSLKDPPDKLSISMNYTTSCMIYMFWTDKISMTNLELMPNKTTKTMLSLTDSTPKLLSKLHFPNYILKLMKKLMKPDS